MRTLHLILCRYARSGFTLVELLVVIGIIVVLIGLLLPLLGRARADARDVQSLSNLRQMLMGYTMYYQDNHNSVMFGYPEPTVCGTLITVYDPVSTQTFSTPISDRYPWRLSPYVSRVWPIIHSHGELPPIPQASDSAGDAWTKAYTLSLNPTYGINSVYVGGDKSYAGFAGPSGDVPNTGKHVVFKATEVKHPTQLIVFADCQAMNTSSLAGAASLAGQGLSYLTPPHANGLNWTVQNDQFQLVNTSLMGIPKGWNTSRTMVGFFDGHVQGMLPSELTDMRLWANWADKPDYDYVN